MNLSLILSCMEKPAKTCVHVISRFVLLTNLQKSQKKKNFFALSLWGGVCESLRKKVNLISLGIRLC